MCSTPDPHSRPLPPSFHCKISAALTTTTPRPLCLLRRPHWDYHQNHRQLRRRQQRPCITAGFFFLLANRRTFSARCKTAEPTAKTPSDHTPIAILSEVAVPRQRKDCLRLGLKKKTSGGALVLPRLNSPRFTTLLAHCPARCTPARRRE